MKPTLFTIGGACIVLMILWCLPIPEKIRTSTHLARIEDRHGRILAEGTRNGAKHIQGNDEIPQEVITALIAIEDRTFWTNPGVSLRGIVRALLRDLQSLRIKEGGSTITQQLVRTKLHPKKRGVLYKCYELWLALKIGTRWEKQVVLDEFLASAYFGQRAYGVQSASRTYFNKSPATLSLSESALLVGLINAPSALNPFRSPVSALARRDRVLRAMRDTGAITEEEYRSAVTEHLQFDHGREARRAEHFVNWVKEIRSSDILNTESVRTTLDLGLQTEVEDIVEYQLEKLKDRNVTSASVVVIDVESGDVLAMVGSADFYDDEHDGQVNVALAERQPGSTLKPFTYALAFERGMTPATTIADIESQFFTQEGNPYIPRNYDYEYHGLVRLREALANSYNIVAVKVLERIGVQSLLSLLKEAGITTLRKSPEHYGLSLTLGSGEVTLLELTRAYALFARAGVSLQERVLLTDPRKEGGRILSPEIAWLITDILSDPYARLAEFGSSGQLDFPFPVATKTGTTRNSRDNWMIGYTPTRVVGVWVGNADNTPMKGTSGVTGAGPIFHDVMLQAMNNMDYESFVPPSSIRRMQVCKLSGKLVTPLCPETITESFVKGTEPREYDDLFRMLPIDHRNSLLARESCEPQYVEMKPFTVFPPELRSWARQKGWHVPPDTYSPLCSFVPSSIHSTEKISITSPAPNTSFLLDPLIPNDQERVILEAIAPEGAQKGEWFIDDQLVATAVQPDFKASWIPSVGRHRVRFTTDNVSDQVDIEVFMPTE